VGGQSAASAYFTRCALLREIGAARGVTFWIKEKLTNRCIFDHHAPCVDGTRAP
jgi:hypothetical protein